MKISYYCDNHLFDTEGDPPSVGQIVCYRDYMGRSKRYLVATVSRTVHEVYMSSYSFPKLELEEVFDWVQKKLDCAGLKLGDNGIYGYRDGCEVSLKAVSIDDI